MRCSERAGHAAPPNFAARATDRLRVEEPVPHEVLQLLNFRHGPTTQSIGHGSLLHSLCCTSLGHAVPPSAGGLSTTRVRF